MAESNWKTEGYDPSKHGFWKATLDDRGDLGYPVGYYFADTVRAIMVAFTNFFNDLYVIRYDENGFPRKRIQVPLKFGPRSKAHDFRKEQESGETYYIPLPNMYYKISHFQYDNARAASSDAIRMFYEDYMMSKGIEEGECQLLWQDTQPVPYNLTFELSAKAEKFGDLLQIIEQITSRFNPEAFIFIKEFWFMNIRRDIKMKLDNMSLDYQDEFGEQDKRELEAKFTFTIEGQVYTKIQEGAIIDKIIVKLNPSIARYETEDVHFTLSAAPGGEKKFYIADSADNWLKEKGLVERVGDYEGEAGIGIYAPVEWAYDAFKYWKPTKRFDIFGNRTSGDKDDAFWEFNSACTSEFADKYTTMVGISGNYAEEPGTYNPTDRSWQGSMKDRFDLASVTEEDITLSGRKDFLNSSNERVDTMWISKHDVEIKE